MQKNPSEQEQQKNKTEVLREKNLHWQNLSIDPHTRATMKSQIPRCVWFTGLSGSGKSTLANNLDKFLHSKGLHTYLLDGDNVRHGLCSDLDFSDAARDENIRRVAHVAHMMVDAGLIVMAAFISPFHAQRSFARSLFVDKEFIEIYVNTSLEVCEKRDVNGFYASARAGKIQNFTGISSPYEPPVNPELSVNGEDDGLESVINQIYFKLIA